jgi:medium-chain acyl-[acyl-carrier-protein] hydrolase
MTPTLFPAWLRPAPSADLRLFCFPYAGGNAFAFRSWREEAPPPLDIWPVQLAGRGHRIAESPFRRLSALCGALVEALGPHLDRPFAFFGHSMGALLAFELARHLRREGRPGPRRLFVSGGRAPRRDRGPLLHNLSDPALLVELERLNGIPAEVMREPDLMSMFLPILRADLELYETYVYYSEVALECPISAFGGWQDSRVSHEDLAAWQEETRTAFSLRMFAGDHFFLHAARASIVRAIFEDLSSPSPPPNPAARPHDV